MIVKALLALFLVSCTYETDFADCVVRCTEDGGCPDSLTCGVEGLCRSAGATETCSAVNEPPSCMGRPPACGPNRNEDCCAVTAVPGGTFFRSYDVAPDALYPNMNYSATVSPFVLDRFEVTVGRFRTFVEAGGGTRVSAPQNGAGGRVLGSLQDQGGWETNWNTALPVDSAALTVSLQCDAAATWTENPGANEQLPVNCITWYEAFAFCVWDGGFLPTESEWNFVAAGGSEQRVYPWSSPASSMTLDCGHANYDACGGSVTPVGSLSPQGDGRWGQADLAGNVWEWTLDWYGTYATPCNDCADLIVDTRRTNRGGGFSFASGFLRTGFRGYEAPAPAYASIGMRCARQLN